MSNQVTPQTAYPTAEQVMNRARAFVNDAFRGGAGRILTDTAPFTIEYLNSAIEELQDKIGNNGVITLIQDNVILTPILPVPNAPNPAVQVFVSYQGYFDGVTMHQTPVLPSNLRAIFVVRERVTGSNLPFSEMNQPQGGIGSRYQRDYLGEWEYRTDALYMAGSTQTEDLSLRIETRFAPLTNATTFADTQIQILSSTNALASAVAYVYARGRGSKLLQAIMDDGARHMRYIVRRYTRRAQGERYNRQPYGFENSNDYSGQGTNNLPM